MIGKYLPQFLHWRTGMLFATQSRKEKINYIADSIWTQDHAAGIFSNRPEADRNWFEAKQIRITGLIENIICPDIFLYVSINSVNIQNVLHKFLRLFLVQQ